MKIKIKTPIKTYIPRDNSYAQCIDDNGKNHYLAGYLNDYKEVELEILVQPFEMENKLFGKRVHTFIIGLDKNTGLRHLVLYHP